MKPSIAAVVLFVAAIAATANAGERISSDRSILESQLRLMSAVIYTDLLRQAEGKGHRFSPESITKGYERHLEELRLQLIDAGYKIVAGEVGA